MAYGPRHWGQNFSASGLVEVHAKAEQDDAGLDDQGCGAPGDRAALGDAAECEDDAQREADLNLVASECRSEERPGEGARRGGDEQNWRGRRARGLRGHGRQL